MLQVIKRIPLEIIIWLGAMLLIYNLEWNEDSTSLCPIHGLGFKWCPGCGLGRSIHLIMHGQFQSSFQMHWMGIPVLLVLSYRIIQLSINFLTQIKLKYDNE